MICPCSSRRCSAASVNRLSNCSTASRRCSAGSVNHLPNSPNGWFVEHVPFPLAMITANPMPVTVSRSPVVMARTLLPSTPCRTTCAEDALYGSWRCRGRGVWPRPENRRLVELPVVMIVTMPMISRTGYRGGDCPPDPRLPVGTAEDALYGSGRCRGPEVWPPVGESLPRGTAATIVALLPSWSRYEGACTTTRGSDPGRCSG